MYVNDINWGKPIFVISPQFKRCIGKYPGLCKISGKLAKISKVYALSCTYINFRTFKFLSCYTLKCALVTLNDSE